MNAYDYLHHVHRMNPKIFKAHKIEISVASLEATIVSAFNAGHEEGIRAGKKQGREEKSMFEQVFGKNAC